jgi:hypothetical protein
VAAACGRIEEAAENRSQGGAGGEADEAAGLPWSGVAESRCGVHRVGSGNLLPIAKGHAPVSESEPSKPEASPSDPVAPENPSGDGLCAPTWSIPEDFGIALDLVYDDPEPDPFINPVKLSTIGALFIDYCDVYWQDRVREWMKDAESKGLLEETKDDGLEYTTYRPFQQSS